MKLKGSSLIIFNTLTSYARILLSVGLGLFATRWILSSLGDSDFGLFSVVGGLIVFVLFIGDALGSSAYRFFAYAIGQNDPQEIQRWFNCTFSVHCLFALFLIIVAIPSGIYLIDYLLAIPEGRLNVCHQLFFFSVTGTVITVIAVPSVGLLIAKQRIFEQNIWGGLHTVLCFALACYLLFSSRDNLLTYALWMMLIKMSIDMIQIIRAYFLYPESHLRRKYLFDKTRYKQLLSFSAWNLLGCLGIVFRNQGTTLLINIFSGAKVNAAYGVANQVASQTNNISSSMLKAISPEIISREGAGERDRMLQLSQQASKFSIFLTFLWLIPLYAELDYVLALWLDVVPTYTKEFCQIILLVYAVDKLTVGYEVSIYAHGKIAKYQFFQTLIIISTFPIIYVLFKMGFRPDQALLAMVATKILHGIGRILWLKHILDVPISYWMSEVFIKCLYVSILPLGCTILLNSTLDESFLRLVLITLSSCGLVLFSSYYWGLTEDERVSVIEKIKKLLCGFCLKFKSE